MQRVGERAHRVDDRLARDVLGRDDGLEARLLGDDAALLAVQRRRAIACRSSVTSRLRASSFGDALARRAIEHDRDRADRRAEHDDDEQQHPQKHGRA